ncbi:MAG: guanylate kinase [Bacteroidales bacterium]|jgi:guanylate kinase|nr:guanylate kinase [Bacteroidales bacterium]MCK9498006.1 guanylate kinase [Bacteroidales bacterium]MDY0314226.1 guanylate kinase [Bacteroidales bacterium]NLB85484.1 guanylate kinase [Bacteroidales bacterium]
MKAKVLIFSAPSGSGKTTIVNHLLAKDNLNLSFSISACTRQVRGAEEHGKDYYFLSVEEFKQKIKNNEFLEWEEVYEGKFYGSLKSEVERLSKLGKTVIFDLDVKGGINIKNFYGDNALSVFIMPPSIEELEKRLINRSTDKLEVIKTRIEKAKYEMSFAKKFDVILINDDLQKALREAEIIVGKFLNV